MARKHKPEEIIGRLHEAGWHVNRKRVERIWRREGLRYAQVQDHLSVLGVILVSAIVQYLACASQGNR